MSDLERTDDALIDAWRRGDGRAGGALLRRHQAAVIGFFKRSGAAAEDLAQETFLQCLRAIASFRGEASFRTFLLSVATNVRRQHQRRGIHAPFWIDVAATDLRDEGIDLDVKIDHDRTRVAVEHAVLRLPDDQRKVVQLQYWSELTSLEIAGLLDVPAGSVRRQQVDARKAVASELRRRALRARRDAE